MSDSGWNATPPAEGPRVPPPPQWGDPRGPGERPTFVYPAYPTTPPPEPPSWLPPTDSSSPAQKPPGRSRRSAIAAGVVALVVVAAGTGAAVGSQLDNNNGSGGSATATTTTTAAAPTTIGTAAQPNSAGSGVPKSYAAIAAEVLPVVVSIDVVSGTSGDTGSGIVIEADGYILTNNHVVAAAAGGGKVTVHFNDGSSAAAKIIGTDVSSDLAVIKVDRTGLQVAHIGSSAGVHVGDAVLAVGSPLGLSGTVTSGIVSALNRPVDTTADQQQQQQPGQGNPFDPFGDNNGSPPSSGPGNNSAAGQQVTVFGAIQTDAAINPGNSGGALVDANGNVIGVNSAIASLGQSVGGSQSGNIGVGFAIPIDLAKNIAEQLIKTGKASHAQLGISVDTNTDRTTGVTKVVVARVPAGTPGAAAGLAVGDVIQKIDSTIATDSDTLIATIRSHLPGDKVTLVISRGGVTKTLTATLGTSTS
jgi:putative serine protease PepD